MNISELRKTEFVKKNHEVKDGFEEMIMHKLMHEAVSKVADKLKVDNIINSVPNVPNKQFVAPKRKNRKNHEKFEITL